MGLLYELVKKKGSARKEQRKDSQKPLHSKNEHELLTLCVLQADELLFKETEIITNRGK